MAEILNDYGQRTAKDVMNDLERVLASVGDDAPLLQLTLALNDYLLIRGLAGVPGVNLIRDYPKAVKALKLHTKLEQNYNGPPRITKVLGVESFDANADRARRDDLDKKTMWLESNVRLRQGITGRPLA